MARLWRHAADRVPPARTSSRTCSSKGYGAVIQGEYGKIPRGLRLQKDFLGGHAIYLDGYYPGNPDKGIPEAYYVIDPLGHPHSGYEGDWWPASVVDDFATAFGGGTHIPTMWAYPPGGVPPQVKDPHVEPIPHGGGPAATPGPGRERGAVRIPESSSPATAPPPAPPVDTPLDGNPVLGGQILIPILEICLVDPPPAGCPTGVPATFQFEPGHGAPGAARADGRAWCSWIRTGPTRDRRVHRRPTSDRRPSATGSTTGRPRR